MKFENPPGVVASHNGCDRHILVYISNLPLILMFFPKSKGFRLGHHRHHRHHHHHLTLRFLCCAGNGNFCGSLRMVWTTDFQWFLGRNFGHSHNVTTAPRNRTLIRAYEGMMVFNNPSVMPYLGVTFRFPWWNKIPWQALKAKKTDTFENDVSWGSQRIEPPTKNIPQLFMRIYWYPSTQEKDNKSPACPLIGASH